MAVRNFVSFEAAVPREGEPPGRELADLLARALADRGIEAAGPEEHEGWAWSLSRRFEGGGIFALVGLTDDPPMEWQIHSYGSRDRKLFGGIGKEDVDRELRAWCEAVDAALRNDDRIRSIRWYDEATFTRDHGATWADAP